ncbi:hypothetical protein GCM10027413_07350 [Conyzicola nivalis]|uniref:Uncharacterized protein n=1 Tax=Conyzicola nivalis TaxID=1477021 RepID=A0A916SKM1_9MICO|nr:hypothetical protein [Conyzicola nivalis]GGB04721.1 hypothetical protein GCM10010979_19280 [Conyzicola nivalis]
MWPYLDPFSMRPEAASALSGLLVVVLFAFLVEFGRAIREVASAKKIRKGKRQLYFAVGWVGVSWLISQLPLLGAVNSGGLTGLAALSVWVVALVQLVILGSGLVWISLVKK